MYFRITKTITYQKISVNNVWLICRDFSNSDWRLKTLKKFYKIFQKNCFNLRVIFLDLFQFRLKLLNTCFHISATDSETQTNDENTLVKTEQLLTEHNECIVCQRSFINNRRLQLHLLKKHFVRSDQIVVKNFKCEKCEKSYTSRANLKKHEQLHTGSIKSFECSECGRVFYKESALINHTSIHTGLKQFKCVDCGKCFTTHNILQQHRKKHMPMRPHKCSICPAAFYTKNDLRVHFRTHTQEQPYLFCLYILFYFLSNLVYSLKGIYAVNVESVSHEKPIWIYTWVNLRFIILLFYIQCIQRFFFAGTHTGQRPFNCRFCSKSFALSGDLTAHIRVSCFSYFEGFNYLLLALFKIHTGNKPYQCGNKQCGKTFNQSSARNIHMKIHAGTRSYVCQICDSAFTQSTTLKRHMKIHIDLEENSIDQ